MNIVEKWVEELKPYENNPRDNDEAVDFVANSIRDFGFKVPIVIDKNNVIVSGHTRYKASKQLGLFKVPCIIADDLTDEQIKQFRLADNKVAEIAKWDDDLLGIELADIEIDMSKFGFEEVEEEIKKTLDKPEIEFTEVLGEEHNYIVLYFDNEIDWLQMESLIDIEPKRNLSTRKDGKMSKGVARTAKGRVFKGKEILERLREQYENIG